MGQQRRFALEKTELGKDPFTHPGSWHSGGPTRGQRFFSLHHRLSDICRASAMTVMPHLTARALAAYLACNTKGQLLSRSTIAETSDFSDLVHEEFKTASAALLEQSTGRRLIRYDNIVAHIAANDERPCFIDCDTTYVDTNQVVPPQFPKNARATSGAIFSDIVCAAGANTNVA